MFSLVDIREFAGPNNRYIPPSLSKLTLDSAITLAVRIYFGVPKCCVGRRTFAALARVAMPETAVNEDCGTMPGDHNVRLPW